MDFKDFHDGLVSSSIMLFLFSTTMIIGAIVFKPYLALEPNDRNLIVIIGAFSMLFSVIHLLAALKVKKIFKLEIKNVVKFVKAIGLLNIIFTPHIFFLLSLLMLNLQVLQTMIILNIIAEGILLGIIYKEAYDLLLKHDDEREEEFQKNQRLYFENR